VEVAGAGLNNFRVTSAATASALEKKLLFTSLTSLFC